MKLSILGYWGAYPEANGATSGYLLQEGSKKILIDCGSAVLSKLKTITNFYDIDAVFLSHYHGDHMADIHCLQYAALIESQLGKRTKNLPIYGLVDKEHFEHLNFEEYTEAIAIREHSIVTIENLQFSFIQTRHPVPCFAMRITDGKKSITYTADTGWFDELVDFSRYSDLLLCESSLYNENKGIVEGHLTAGEAGKLASLAEVDRLILTHLPHFGNHQQLLKEARAEFKGKVDLASTIQSVDL